MDSSSRLPCRTDRDTPDNVQDAVTGLTYMEQRYYDPGIGRFLSRDPISALKGPFNRYWYANANPYRFTDPDGRVVKMVGKGKKLEKLKADYARIGSKPAGAALIKALEDAPQIVTIVASRQMEIDTTPDGTNDDIVAGKSMGSKIDYNPDKQTGGRNSEGSTKRPGFVDLAHELGHAKALIDGAQSLDPGTKEKGTTPPREEQSMQAENAVRGEHAIPLRPSYYF